MLKALIWIVTAVGLLPAILVLITTVSVLRAQQQLPEAVEQPETEGTPLIYHHDTWIQVGPFKGAIYPRLWATVVLAIGIALVLVGLFWQLYVL